ncbi:MAG: hypothetical protein HOV80_13045 [Polyangiaceae bacterium]|nr:hypothetical protein [Polyangiaceae bacterium]
MALSWCKVASNLDSHPKIRRAGRNGREVFLFALRRNAEPGNPVPGRLPKAQLEAWYIADQLMMSESDASDGIARAVTAELLVVDGDAYQIVGWNDDEWGRPFTGSERTRAWRDKRRQQPSPDVTDRHAVTNGDDSNVTPSHEVTLGDACDGREERRSEEKRGDEKEKNSARPSGGGAPLELEPPRPAGKRKPRPSDPTEAELASVRVVLEKLTARNGVRYSGTAEHTRLIVGRLREGASEMDLRVVIGYCAEELGWKGDPAMEKFLRPETLFGPKTIAKYLDPARAWFAKLPPDEPVQHHDADEEPDWMRGGEA